MKVLILSIAIGLITASVPSLAATKCDEALFGEGAPERLTLPKRIFRVSKVKPLDKEQHLVFRSNVAMRAMKKNDEVLMLAWTINEFGILEEMRSVTEYLQIFSEKIKDGYDLNSRDEAQRTPLMHAATSGFQRMYLALLKMGADVSLVDKDGFTAADLSMKVSLGPKTDLYYVEKYLSYGGFYIADGVWEAFNNRNFDRLSSLFKRGIYVDIFDLSLGRSLLVYAIENRDLEMMAFLLKHGADPNFGAWGDSSNSNLPVLAAVETLNVDAIRLLLKYGAQLDARGLYTHDVNPVRHAIWNAVVRESYPIEPSIQMIDWLFKQGANPDAHSRYILSEFLMELLWDIYTDGSEEFIRRKAAILDVLDKNGVVVKIKGSPEGKK